MGYWKTSLKLALWIGGIALIVGGTFRIFFVTPITAGHDGMAPTILAAEKVLLWRDAAIEMGDIVVCDNPREPGAKVIGRVLARGGMTIGTDERNNLEIAGSRVEVDWQEEIDFFDADANQEVRMRQAVEKFGNTEHTMLVRDGQPFRLSRLQIPAGKVFVLGDNRTSRQHDSRTFGPVSETSCLGTVFMRWNPEARGEPFGHGWLDLLE